ncbi:MAG: YkgJ family cysteine cluster protein [Acidobacteria bacterium]|nr:YkgJ family cysteine cluster protein [Acidobacteriota bacterium]
MSDEWITGNFTLRVHGEPIEMEVTVPTAKVRPTRMLPLFEKMASSVVDACVAVVEGEGKKISCKAGCGACCRQAVPISEVEAYRIAEIVDAMPPERQAVIRQRFAEALAHFRKIKWFDELIGLKDMAYEGSPEFSPEKYAEVVTKYMKQGYACPFLENESCSIHADRPAVCREYLVTSPAENCVDPRADTIEKVPIFLRPSKALLKFGKTETTENWSSVMLIEALDLVENNPDRLETKTGPEWTEEFFKALASTEKILKDDPPPAKRRKKARHSKKGR